MQLSRALVLVFAAMLAGCGGSSVVRLVDGRPEVGRFIGPEAYALYGRGASAEAQGDVTGALRAYQAAADADPESPEIWTRLGALRCREALSVALPELARAEAADPSFGPLHRERARCLLAHGRVTEALAASRRAVALDPEDLEASLVYASALERAGRSEEARLALRALTVSHPGAVGPWRALAGAARRAGDVGLTREAAERADRLSPSREPVTLGQVDAALLAGDMDAALRLSRRAHLASADIAVRAAALGLVDAARERGALVLGAEPANASARIAVAAAADLSGDTAALAGAMRRVPARSTAPSPLSRVLFAEVLARRVGVDAARAWLDALPETGSAGDDPVLAAAVERVRKRLATR